MYEEAKYPISYALVQCFLLLNSNNRMLQVQQ